MSTTEINTECDLEGVNNDEVVVNNDEVVVSNAEVVKKNEDVVVSNAKVVYINGLGIPTNNYKEKKMYHIFKSRDGRIWVYDRKRVGLCADGITVKYTYFRYNLEIKYISDVVVNGEHHQYLIVKVSNETHCRDDHYSSNQCPDFAFTCKKCNLVYMKLPIEDKWCFRCSKHSGELPTPDPNIKAATLSLNY